ncbi:hypothetical protein PR048_016085 [Dryococelus australis]|uniref:CUB domain-containing protein n=1 Tax=Dryococelus australis TaxID=614101 RepID=A0ABQ9HJX7_9NEOP|nr:hypothetical protein PR048_016085 [Dryococelus australis]
MVYVCLIPVSSVEEAGCYLRLEALAGYLESPNYPEDYPTGLECCYDIARPSQMHSETFHVLKTTDDGDFCLSDWFVMSSCVPVGSSRHCGNLTGTTFYYLFQPGSRAMRFIFHSSNERRHSALSLYRYRIRYRMLTDCVGLFQEPLVSDVDSGVPCYTRLTSRRGSIRTPFHPGYYPKNIDCVYEFFR